MPPARDHFMSSAQEFLNQYHCLIGDFNEAAGEDLLSLFSSFAGLALRLWKKKATILVPKMIEFAPTVFEVKSKYMVAEFSAKSTLGERLDGRPIGVMMNPLIVSQPVVRQGPPAEDVVWMNAVIWVSGNEEEERELDRNYVKAT